MSLQYQQHLGFLCVFAYNDGKWINEDKQRAHAITGIIVIGLAFLQPFIALFRCEPNSQYRFIFNYFHACVGFVTFILSCVGLLLATINFKGIFSTSSGWIIMIGWICWLICICIIFECVQRRNTASDSSLNRHDSSNGSAEDVGASSVSLITNLDANESNKQRLKMILLVLHICVATGASIALMVPILKFD